MKAVFSRSEVSALIAAGLVVAAPALAQTTDDTSHVAIDGTPTTVTVFAPQRRSTAANSQAYINPYTASSCGFMADRSEYADSVAQSYMDDMYGANRDANETSPLEGVERFNGLAPWGDASTGRSTTLPGLTAGTGRKGGDNRTGCTGADAAFAAGRAYIASHDTSLRDAYAALDAKDYPKAYGLFKTAWSKIGYPDAALLVGEMELYGEGTPADPKDAIIWFKKIADIVVAPAKVKPFDPANPYDMSPNEEAAVLLAKMYLTGFKVAPDINEARHWYSKAGEMGYMPALQMVGLMYAHGDGVPVDAAKAATYFKKAGQAGFAPAQYEMGQLYYNGDGVAQDKTEAGAWLLQSAKHGYLPALYAAGRMYELGEGGASADDGKAAVFYKEAATKGFAPAQDALGRDFYLGKGVAKDLTLARQLFQQAAQRGDAQGMFDLAVMLSRGEGGPADPASAYAWMRLAQIGGVAHAGEAADELAGKLTPEQRAKADHDLAPVKGEMK